MKTRYSTKGEVTNDHSLYWHGLVGMYLLWGFAFKAYCIQFRCKIISLLAYIFWLLLHGIYLIFVKGTVLESCFTLILEGNDDKTNKNVDHKEGNYDDINKIKDCNNGTVAMLGSNIGLVWINGDIQNPKNKTIEITLIFLTAIFNNHNI